MKNCGNVIFIIKLQLISQPISPIPKSKNHLPQHPTSHSNSKENVPNDKLVYAKNMIIFVPFKVLLLHFFKLIRTLSFTIWQNLLAVCNMFSFFFGDFRLIGFIQFFSGLQSSDFSVLKDRLLLREICFGTSEKDRDRCAKNVKIARKSMERDV